jgi:DHA2 family multidrug resistance protein-like MFS transporter
MTDGLPTPRRYLAVLAVSCGTALAVIDGSIVTVALPTLARDLHVDPSSAVLVVTVYQLALVMTLLPFSALGTRVGLRRLYQYGQLLFLISTVLCFFIKSLPFLLLVRTLQALGAAAALSVSSALIRQIYPARQLGRGLAIGNAVVASAGALAPTLGGLVLSVAAWPWLFVVGSPLAAASLLIGRHTLPDPQAHNEPYDVPGALLCALTFGLLIAGIEGMVRRQSTVIPAAVLIAGIALAVLFVRRELGGRQPILPVDLLVRPEVSLAVVGGLCCFIASMSLLLSLPFRLQRLGFAPGEIGAMISPWPLAMMFVSPAAGMLSDRIPAATLGAIGMSIATAALLLLAFLPADLHAVDVVWRIVLCGVGFGLYLSPNARLIINSAPHDRAASAGALISTTRLVGQTLGATLMAAMLAIGVGSHRTPAFVAAGLTLFAGACSLVLLRPGNRR